MRARRHHLGFDSLDRRITPTDLVPVVPSTTVCPGPMPGSDTTVINNLGGWQVAGDPQIAPVTLIPAPLDTSTWVVTTP